MWMRHGVSYDDCLELLFVANGNVAVVEFVLNELFPQKPTITPQEKPPYIRFDQRCLVADPNVVQCIQKAQRNDVVFNGLSSIDISNNNTNVVQIE